MALADAAPPRPLVPARVAREQGARTRRKVGLRSGTKESLAVFIVAYAVYLAIGYQLAIVQHLTVFDATARLAHGYFVWWNDPTKLAAIGFVWAPVSTLVFLPFTLVKPLATSLMALPATSGFYMAFMLAFIMTGLREFGLPWWARVSTVLLVGLNPLVVFYAINGMSEGPFLGLLTAGLVLFIRWHRTGSSHLLPLSAVTMTLAGLCRYEVVLFALLIAAAVPVTLRLRRRSQLEIEGSTLIYIVPIVFGVGLWAFFNWLVLGDALFWLKLQVGGGTNTTVAGTVGVSAADAASSVVSDAPKFGVVGVAWAIVKLNAHIFLPLLIVPPLLFILGLVRRSSLAIWIALLTACNAATTFLYYAYSHDNNLLQLRYNMRGIPVAVLGLGLLVSGLPRRIRTAATGVMLALLLVAVPVTWATMRDYPYQYLENVFVTAVSSGDNVENAGTGGLYTVGTADEREMAAYIKAYVPEGRRSILTDDAQTFGVMLTAGRPGEFWDRIDLGDTKWIRAAKRPYGKVRYLLVARYPLPPFEIIDELQKRYPGMRPGQLPGLSVEHVNAHYALLRLSRRRPARASRFSGVLDAIMAGRTPRL